MTNELKPYQEETLALSEQANITIIDHVTLQSATSTLSQLNQSLDRVTEHKELKTKPINQALKQIRQDYKPIETLLDEAIQSLRYKITAYATLQDQLAKQQEQKILEDKRTTNDTKIQKLSEIQKLEPKIKTEAGSISFVSLKKYRVIDITQIPIEFMQPNDTAISLAMERGQKISGIEFYEEKSLRNYRS